MWDASSGWKLNEFAELFPDEALKMIAAYEITQGEDNEDQLVWEETLSGGFSICSAVQMKG